MGNVDSIKCSFHTLELKHNNDYSRFLLTYYSRLFPVTEIIQFISHPLNTEILLIL